MEQNSHRITSHPILSEPSGETIEFSWQGTDA